MNLPPYVFDVDAKNISDLSIIVLEKKLHRVTAQKKSDLTFWKSSQNFQAYKSMRVKKEIWLPIFYKWYRLEAKQAKIKLPDYWVNYTQAENPTEL